MKAASAGPGEHPKHTVVLLDVALTYQKLYHHFNAFINLL